MAKKSAYSVRIKNSNDYVFWMIEHGSTQPRDEFVYNAEMGTTRDNPRTEEELEFREQFFCFMIIRVKVIQVVGLKH